LELYFQALSLEGFGFSRFATVTNGVQVRFGNAVSINQPMPPSAFNMVAIPPGVFQMGSTAVGGTAVPVHAVTITRPFWIGQNEVTQAQYQAVMGNNPSFWQGPQLPVEQVSWFSALAYCAALTASESAAGRVPPGYQYRLPTEAEWEYCCRAGTTTEWNTGTTLSTSLANFGGGNSGQTIAGGSYPPNPWGLFDAHGNVWEWCLDSWDASANYPAAAILDPYVSSGPNRVLRGGSCRNSASSCRSSLRGLAPPSFAFAEFGFRVVLAPILVP
jgi:formylglycine-generating enzyme required for sulfatase activity